MRLVASALFAFLLMPLAAFATSDVAAPDPTPAPAAVVDAPAEAATPPAAPTAVVVTPDAPVVVAPAAPVAEEKKETSVFGKLFGSDSDTKETSAPSANSPMPKEVSEKAEAIKASNARHSEENADEREGARREFIQERNQRKADILAKAGNAPRPAAPPVVAPKAAVVSPAVPAAAVPAVAAPAEKADAVESE